MLSVKSMNYVRIVELLDTDNDDQMAIILKH